MKRILIAILLLMPLFGYSQYAMRSFTATVTFSGFSTVNDSTFQGDLGVNDQTNLYDGTDIQVGDIVFSSGGRTYRVDVVNSASLFTANVDLVDIQDASYTSPTGTGQIGIKTTNYGFLTYTPDNANGFSQQAKSILETHNWNFLDSILPSQLTGDAFNLASIDQIIEADRLISGSDTYDLTLDSFPQFNLHAIENYLTDSTTSATDWLSTTNRYLKKNSGMLRINSLGLDYSAIQNTNGADELHFVWAADDELRLGSIRKAVSSVATMGPIASFDPEGFNIQYEDTLSGVRGRLFIGQSEIAFTGTDSLTINLGKLIQDDAQGLVLAIDTVSGRVYIKNVGGEITYDAGNGAEVTATGTGVTFTRTSATVGTFDIPSGVEVKRAKIEHTSGETTAIGNTYYVRFDYAGSVDYNNTLDDVRVPEVTAMNIVAPVANSRVVDSSNKIVYHSTTGTTNLQLYISGLISTAGYLQVELENYDDAVGGSSNPSMIEIKF